MKNIVDLIVKENKKHLKNYAVIDGEERISYSRLFEAVDRTSRRLKKLGLYRHSRVALLCEDSIEYVIISLAILKLYAVIVPIPSGSVSGEIEDVLARIKVNFVIFEDGSYSAKEAFLITGTCGLKKNIRLFSRSNEENLPPGFYKLNPAFIRFTSGTTGESKGVVISHASIIERTAQANKGLKVKSSDQIIWVLAMSFHFVVTILLFLRRGASIILSNRKFPESLLEGLKTNRATFIYASPVHYNMISGLGVFSKGLLSNVRMAVSTAVKLPLGIAAKFSKKFGFELSEAYGIIEAGLPFINTSRDKSKRGSVGKIIPGYKVKIAEKDTSGIGKIYIKGRGLFDAYFSPWQPRGKVLVGGYFDTGDLGRLDKDGFLFISGRDKYVINFCGMKIFPAEVENVLNQYQEIRESLVFGMNHPQYGQLPVARIVLRQGKNKSLDIEKLRRYCYERLVSYKVPKDFQVVGRLPKTLSGKIKRFAL